MIDKQLIQELDYNDFLPLFRKINDVMNEMDSRDIRLVVGDRVVDRFEDGFIRLVLATFKQLEK